MSSSVNSAAEGHHEVPVAEAAQISTSSQPLGEMGRRFSRRSPFLIGMAAAAGVAVTYGLVQTLVSVVDVLGLIGLSMFLAIGLEPLVSWLAGRGF